MNRLIGALACLLYPAVALGQTPPPVVPPASSLNPLSVPPAQAVSPYPETWLPRPNVELTGLDKITTRLSAVAGKVGQPISFGTLSVTVRSCIVRGPDQPADQAAFLDVTDSRNAAFAFHGWMMLSAPGVSVIEHPVYDLRLAGCRA